GQAQVGAVVDHMQLLQIEPRQAYGASPQLPKVLYPAAVAGWIARAEPAEPEEVLRELPLRLLDVERREDAPGPVLGRPRADRPAEARLATGASEVRAAAGVIGGHLLGRELADHVLLEFARDLDDRDRLRAECACPLGLPRRHMAERRLRPLRDLRRVDAV